MSVADGVRHLQLLGARYYMAFSAEALTQANAHPDLRPVANTGRWTIYEVQGSELVSPLNFQPAVVTGPVKGEVPWLNMSVNWYTDFGAQDVFLAASGPKEWERVEAHKVESDVKTHGSTVTVDEPGRRPVQPAQVTDIRSDDNDISFDVDRTGSPVLVKASYFPNWRAKGAKGPYRVTPNLMVVIPTSNHVSLHYGFTPAEGLGYLLTFGGFGLAVYFGRQGTVRFDDPRLDTEPAISADEPGTAPPPPPPSRPPVTVPDRGS